MRRPPDRKLALFIMAAITIAAASSVLASRTVAGPGEASPAALIAKSLGRS